MRAIIAGNHHPADLASYRDVRWKASVDTVRAARNGNYRPEQVFALRQALELYDSYQEKIAACDTEIEATLASREPDHEVSLEARPAARDKTRQANEPHFQVREALLQVVGTDLSQGHGFSAYTVLKLVGECGTDMTKWPTAKHFTSWLTLAPGHKISGGKVLRTKTRRASNRAAKILPGGSQPTFLTGLAHLYNFIPYQRRAQHAGQCGVEVDGGHGPTADWFLNLQILTSGGFR